ncbi:MAG: hypothetical protein ACFE7E_08630 [Candidatus Hodarchaeota archaeon]
MFEERSLAGLFGQVLIIISAVMTIIFSLIMSFPISPDSPLLFSIIQTPPFGLHIIDFYYYYTPPYLVYGSQYSREYNIIEDWFYLTSGSSLTGIINSTIFFISIMLVVISIYKTAQRSGENSDITVKAKSLFKATSAFACLAYFLSILSHTFSLVMVTYSYERIFGYFVGFPSFSWVTHIYLNSFGWILLILQNTFGVMMMVLVGVFFKAIASRMQKSSQQTIRLWPVIGKTYTMLGGMIGLTVFTTLAQANMTFLVPIMVIVSGVMGVACFTNFKPTMFPIVIGTTGSIINTTGTVARVVYDTEELAEEIELEALKNEGNKFIIISEIKCLGCSHENPTDAEFCVGCGQRLK